MRKGAIALAVPVALAVAALSAAPSAGHALSVARAEQAARKAVLGHPSYKQIASSGNGLVTRSCRRRTSASVKCRLYVVVPSPCALGRADPDTVCAQALWERRWLVRVTRGSRGTPTAHILKVSSGPSAGAS